MKKVTKQTLIRKQETGVVYDVMFQGKKYLLIGSRIEGAIATQEEYESFGGNYAHLYPDGVKQYGRIIGKVSDVKILGKNTKYN